MQSTISHGPSFGLRSLSSLLCAAGLALVPAVRAQSATFVSDINKTTKALNSIPAPKRAERNGYQEGTRFAQVGGQAVFQASGPKTSNEVFASRGTRASSVLLKDCAPGGNHGFPEQFTVAGTKFYFRVNDGVHGNELWVSDGTSKGTVFVTDLESGYASSQPDDICPIGSSGKVVFRAYNSTTGSELYVSDGTAKGTFLLKDINPGSASSIPSFMRGFNDGKRDLVVFQASETTSGTELYVTDGTSAGTGLLKDIQPGGGYSNPQNFQVLGNKVLFSAFTSTQGAELWITDGTAAGTTLVKDVYSGVQSGTDLYHAVLAGGKLYFAGTTAVAGKEIWVTDGTPAGTKIVADTNVGSGDGQFLHGEALDHRILYQGKSTAAGEEPWVLDTKTGVASQLVDLWSGTRGSKPEYFVLSGGKMFFSAATAQEGAELLITDGTPQGTQVVKDISVGSYGSSPRWLTSISQGRILFAAKHQGAENVWTSDGTSQGTIAVPVGTDQLPSQSSGVQSPAAFRGRLIFSAFDGLTGTELWSTDGTDKGTHQIKDLYPGANSNGSPNSSAPMGMTQLGNMLVFAADDGQGLGRELWATDGTAAGTRILVDIFGGPGSSHPARFKFIGTTLYLSAAGYDQAVPRNYVGQELFVTDGTAAGTRNIADLYPGYTSSLPKGFTELGSSGRFVFSAYSPSPKSSRESLGHELWVSDGTTAGTHLLMDIQPGTTSSFPRSFQALGNKVYFVATTASQGEEVWVTDGTVAGTKILADLVLGATSSKPRFLCAYGGKLFFHAWTQSSGYELFVSDGTAAGTKLFLDILAGTASSFPRDLTSIGSRYFYFSATGNGGQELWRSDGTTSGTAMYADVWPGWYSSRARGFQLGYNSGFVSLGDRVFLAATQEDTGEELYYVSNGATATLSGQGCRASILLSTDPVLGSQATVSGTTQAGFVAHLLLLGTIPLNSLPLGGGCRFYLDLTGPLVTLQTSTGRNYSAKIPIPATPALLGARMRLQSLHPGLGFPLSSGFSNGVDWTIGK
jgi:ELWxxDGT repeat protein